MIKDQRLKLSYGWGAQTLPRLSKYEEVLKHAVKRTLMYVEQVLQATDKVITKNNQSAFSLAGWRLIEAREV